MTNTFTAMPGLSSSRCFGQPRYGRVRPAISFLCMLLALSCSKRPQEVGHSKAAVGPYSYDLDGDGINDTSLEVRCCTTDPNQCTVSPPHYCLNVDSALLTPSSREIALHPEARPASQGHSAVINSQTEIRLVGDHTGDLLHKVALLYVRERAPSYTVCGYSWPVDDPGQWLTHVWTAADCSNGLPQSGWAAIGQGQNGANTSGIVQCGLTAGAHYNHPSVGRTTSKVTCLYSPPTVQQSKPNMTICTYYWPTVASGWRYHDWEDGDCSNGTPTSGMYVIGSGSNGSGTGGMADCTPTQGGHYNLLGVDGETMSQVWCAYTDPANVADPAVTLCDYRFAEEQTGLRTHVWTAADCSHGLPSSNSVALGQATNGNGAPQQATCSPTSGSHYNITPTSGRVRCLFVKPGPGQTYYSPALAVIDVAVGSRLADAASPIGLGAFYGYALSGFTLYPHGYPYGPVGKIYPAMTPGYGDDVGSPSQSWQYGCLFQLGAAFTRECGSNMLKINTADGFREVGGYLQDLDGDLWEDITLIYHWRQRTISSRTGQLLTSTYYDVAAGQPPQGFHSGRNYGVHSAVTGTDGKLRTVMSAGTPVGAFNDIFCNVSRFVGVLETTPFNPASRALRWAHFLGFADNSWTEFPCLPGPPPNCGAEAPTPARWGDFANGCVHRFSDSRSVMDGTPVMVFDYFAADYADPINAALAGRCKNEQYQLYVPPTWTEEKQAVWYACLNRHLGAKGRWGMSVKRELDGAQLTGSQDTYIWGHSATMVPGGQFVYLVESLPNPVRFDLKQDDGVTPIPQTQLSVRGLAGGLWTFYGNLPVVGRPVPRHLDAEGTTSLGVGSYTEVLGLWLQDRDGDGYDEVLIREPDDTLVWVGWDIPTGTFMVKP